MPEWLNRVRKLIEEIQCCARRSSRAPQINAAQIAFNANKSQVAKTNFSSFWIAYKRHEILFIALDMLFRRTD